MKRQNTTPATLPQEGLTHGSAAHIPGNISPTHRTMGSIARLASGRMRHVTGGIVLITTVLGVQAAEIRDRADVRRNALARFDKDGNGRLDASEREMMRMELKNERLKSGGGGMKIPADVLADYDTNRDGDMSPPEWAAASIAEKSILTKQFDADGNGSLSDTETETMLNVIRTKPVRFARDYFAYMMKYDLNGNGEFDGDEYQKAQAAEGVVVVKTYDKNGNSVLDPEERKKLQDDLRRGAIPGFYARFAGGVAGGGERNSLRGPAPAIANLDLDGDGLASAEELNRARASRQPASQK